MSARWRALMHRLRHEWGAEVYWFYGSQRECEHLRCEYPGCSAACLRDPGSGIRFGYSPR